MSTEGLDFDRGSMIHIKGHTSRMMHTLLSHISVIGKMDADALLNATSCSRTISVVQTFLTA